MSRNAETVTGETNDGTKTDKLSELLPDLTNYGYMVLMVKT